MERIPGVGHITIDKNEIMQQKVISRYKFRPLSGWPPQLTSAHVYADTGSCALIQE